MASSATTTALHADAGKWLSSAFYREAVENMVLYNTQLIKDRKSRLPYVDAQTGIAQSNSHLLRSRLERRRGLLPGQIYSYPPYRWRQESRPAPLLKKDTLLEPIVVQGASPAGGLIQTMEGGVVTKRSSRLAGIARPKEPAPEGGIIMPAVPRIPLESPASSEMNEEDESPDADYDLEDYDSEEEKRKKKRRPPPKSNRSSGGGVAPPRPSRSSDVANDKPFHCSACNRRYKTAASLKAHRTQYHGGQPSSRGGTPAAPPLPPSASESRIPVILPPPPNLLGKEDAKPNPYCDFCLGEDHMNNKTKQPEKMVSCANCGRSAHPSCMQFSETLSMIVRTYRWQCIECKSCHFCGTSENDDQLLFCDDCDRGYHMYCLKPPLKEPPEGNWSCGMCYK